MSDVYRTPFHIFLAPNIFPHCSVGSNVQLVSRKHTLESCPGQVSLVFFLLQFLLWQLTLKSNIQWTIYYWFNLVMIRSFKGVKSLQGFALLPTCGLIYMHVHCSSVGGSIWEAWVQILLKPEFFLAFNSTWNFFNYSWPLSVRIVLPLFFTIIPILNYRWCWPFSAE